MSDNATPFDNQNYIDWQSQGKHLASTALAYDLTNLTEDKAVDKELVEIFTERANYINSLFEEEYFLFEDSLMQVVADLSQRLLAANEIRNEQNIRFLIARSGIPNAACLGDGTIILNLGLISRLENCNRWRRGKL